MRLSQSNYPASYNKIYLHVLSRFKNPGKNQTTIWYLIRLTLPISLITDLQISTNFAQIVYIIIIQLYWTNSYLHGWTVLYILLSLILTLFSRNWHRYFIRLTQTYNLCCLLLAESQRLSHRTLKWHSSSYNRICSARGRHVRK